MENKIIERYAKLNEACKKYPEIVLSGIEERGGYLKRSKNAKSHERSMTYVKDGFIEKFCR